MSIKLFRNTLSCIHLKRFGSSSSSIGYDLKGYRSLLSIKGADASVYLQNLITNDIYSLNPTENHTTSRSLFAMMLNNRGRIMYDTLVHLINPEAGAAREYFIELDTSLLDECLSKLLVPLKLRKKVEINKIDADYKLFAIKSDDNCPLKQVKNDNVLLVESDPRYSSLGHRVIIKTKDSNSKSKLKLIIYTIKTKYI